MHHCACEAEDGRSACTYTTRGGHAGRAIRSEQVDTCECLNGELAPSHIDWPLFCADRRCYSNRLDGLHVCY